MKRSLLSPQSADPEGSSALLEPHAVDGERGGDVGANLRGTAHLLCDLAAFGRVTASEARPAPNGNGALRGHAGETLGTAARAVFKPFGATIAARSESGRLTCLIADDHPIVREAIGNVLERHGITVVARVGDGDAAIAAILEKRPAAALVDLRLPSLDGLAVARETSRLASETAVILYTGADPTILGSALDSGARGFMLKEAPVADIARAVKMVAGGQLYFDPALASFLVASPAAKTLGSRDLEILRLLADGCTYETIGKHLFLSSDTVRTHVRALTRKLNVRTRTEAVATALREQLIA